MSGRNELARVLFCSRWRGRDPWDTIARWYGWYDAREVAFETADDILASPWLEAERERVRAETEAPLQIEIKRLNAVIIWNREKSRGASDDAAIARIRASPEWRRTTDEKLALATHEAVESCVRKTVAAFKSVAAKGSGE